MAARAAAHSTDHIEARYLQATALVNFRDPSPQAPIAQLGWRELPERKRIGAIYHSSATRSTSVTRDGRHAGLGSAHGGHGQSDTKAPC